MKPPSPKPLSKPRKPSLTHKRVLGLKLIHQRVAATYLLDGRHRGLFQPWTACELDKIRSALKYILEYPIPPKKSSNAKNSKAKQATRVVP